MLETELVPAREHASRRLMVVLHGLGDSIEGYRWMPDMLNLPYLNYLLVNAPDDYYGGFSWFDIFGQPDPGVKRSRELLFHLLDEQCAKGYLARQIVMFGFSQGGTMTIEVGARYPHPLAGLIGISGFVHDPDSLLAGLSPVAKQQRFLLTHGTHDPLIPIGPVRRQVAALQEAGLNVQWQEFFKPHTIAGEEELRLIRDFVEASFTERENSESP